MKNSEKQKTALRVAYLSGLFTVLVCLVMLLNYWQLRRTDPLESKALKSLVEQLEDSRGNETLKEEVRALDLMARKAYFTKQWQIRAGSYLLVGGMILLVVALRIYYSLRARIPEPVPAEAHLEMDLLVSRKWILYVVFLIFGTALLASFLSIDHLAEGYGESLAENQAEGNAVEEISIRTPETQGMEETMPGNDQLTEMTVKKQIEMESGVNQGERVDQDKETVQAAIPVLAAGADYLKNFPSFRGPDGLGVSHQKNIPTDWDGTSGKNVIWKKAIPLPGYNSPVIWGDKLFLTGANASSQVVYCYNRNTGEVIWEHPVNDIQRSLGTIRKPTDDTGYAAPTVVTDGQYLLAIFASGDLICLDLNGHRKWAKNLGIPDNHYGHSSSLLIWKNLLLVQFDTNKAGKLLAFSTESGEQKWETARKSKVSWASPILASVDGKPQVVLASSPQVAAYDPANGTELWSVECLTGEVGASPAFSNGIVFAANEYSQLVAIRPVSPPEILWQSNEYLPEVSSPVAAGGLVFIATSYGVIAAFDMDNGEMVWEHECMEGIYASPVVADGKVYFLDMGGNMYIFKLSASKELIGEPKLGEETVATPALSEGRIYMRGRQHLYCIGPN